nr:ABC transporter permease [Syntrophales bacterium]
RGDLDEHAQPEAFYVDPKRGLKGLKKIFGLEKLPRRIEGVDIAVVALKALFFGVGITVISLHYGLAVRRGITEVPVATSRGAVACLFYCLAVNFALFAAFFL